MMIKLYTRGKKKLTILLMILVVQLIFINYLYAFTSTKPNIPCPFGINVNSYTGNLFYQRTDLFIKGRGLSINIVFSYNSGRTLRDWGYGRGWSFPYSMQYYFDNSSIIIERSDGRKDEFTWNGSSYDSPVGVYDVLTEYQAEKYLLTTKHGTKYYFDDSVHKKITKTEDRYGNTMTFSYTNGNLSTITDPSGRQLSLSWTDDHLSQITDNNTTPNRVISYQYDIADNMIQVTDPDGNTISYGYGSWSNIISITDARSNSVNIIYNANKAVSEISTAITNKTFIYNTNNRTTSVTSGTQTTVYTFSVNGRVTSIQLPSSHTISYTWDSDNNVTSYTNAESITTNYTYDSKGNMLTETNAFGTRTYTYESNFNNVLSIQDRNGNTTTYAYDSNGNLTGVNKPLGVSESYTYDNYGNRTSFTDGNSNTTNYSYNSNGNVTSITYPIGSENFTYDGIGNRLSATDANSNETTFSYDKLNRLTQVSDPLFHTTNYTYDANGNMTSVTDANSNTISYTYDALNRLTRVSTPTGNTSYTYDEYDNLTSMQDANGHTTTYTYNSQNLLSSETDPAGNTTSYTYDNNGNVATRTDGNGNLTNYSYDNADRLTGKTYSGNADSYGYDNEGNMTSASNNDYSISYTYDALNRLTSKAVTTWGKSISYTYDDAGNRLTMTDPDGGVTNYTYDANNNLITLQNSSSQTTSFTYDNGGRITRQDNANGTYTTYSYNSADNLTALVNRNSSGTVLSSYSYTYDNNGNRLSMTDKDSGVNSYTYDNTDQLTDVTYSDASSESFTYDSWGNRTKLVKDGVTTNYTYNNADMILTAGSVSYTFDDNGNMTSKTESGNTTTYTYDGENRLIQVTFPDALTNTFTYCFAGLRMSKTDSIGATTLYFYDGQNAIMEMNSGGTTVAHYTSGLGIDEWISMDRDDSSYYYHKDGLDSMTGISDSKETIVKTYDYDVFGQIKNEAGSLTNSYCFTGRALDNETKLNYYRARYYESNIGRFITKDSFKNMYLNNAYNYVSNNPINYTDPLGYIKCKPDERKTTVGAFSNGSVGSCVKAIMNAYGGDWDLLRRIYQGGCTYAGSKVAGRGMWNWISRKTGKRLARTVFTKSAGIALAIVPWAVEGGTALWAWRFCSREICVKKPKPPEPNPPDEDNRGDDDDTSGGGGDQDGGQGGGGGETKPVTLTSFTSEYVNNLATLHWATQSELDNMGWYIYRGKNDDSFTNSERINNELIEGYGTTTSPHEYVYQDPLEGVVIGDTLWYWLESIDYGGEINHYNMVAQLVVPDVTDPDVPPEIPIIYGLYQNLPNPFNPTNVSKTRVFFCLYTSADVKINIYNIKGQLVRCIYDKYTEFDDDNPQPKVAYWDGTDEQGKSISAGVYLYKMFKNNEVEETKKIILMR